MKKIIFLLIFLCAGIISFGQQKDYDNIKFKSKLRHYSKTIPNTKDNGIDRASVEGIVDILSADAFTAKEKLALTNKLWLAISNPKKFDFVYKDYSLHTIKNWGVKIKFEDPNFEPNPYLKEWTNKEDDFIYFQWVLTNILTYEKLLAYGDEAKPVGSALKRLLLVNDIRLPKPLSTDYPDTYLNRMNKYLVKRDLIILMFQNNFDFLVCKIEDQDKLVLLLDKFHWTFVTP